MRYRPFGRTGREISELVFGGGWVGGILIHQEPATKSAAIKRALAAGINWIAPRPPTAMANRSRRSAGCSRTSSRPALPVDQGAARSVPADDIIGQVRRSTEESLAGCAATRSSCCSCTIRSARRPSISCRGRPGAGRGRGRRCARAHARRGPDPAHRHHRDRRYRGLPPRDRERPVRIRPRSTTTSSIRAPARTCRPPGRGATSVA